MRRMKQIFSAWTFDTDRFGLAKKKCIVTRKVTIFIELVSKYKN